MSLKPLKKSLKRFNNIGFDIETYGQENKFLMGSLFFNEDKIEFFDDKKALIRYILKNHIEFRDSIIWAHNLGFDFLGCFGETNILKNFQMIQRGSDLIFAKSYIHNGKFHFNKMLEKRCTRLLFYDTMSFFKGSLAKVGLLIGNKKLESPKRLGEKPKTQQEWGYLKDYNINDSRICKKFADFLQQNFNNLGCQIKSTIAGTAMDLFQRKYLEGPLYQPPISRLPDMLKGYYGGRTEIFNRGHGDEPINIYDFNSLYPYVMKNFEYPDVNTAHYTGDIDISQIKDYEGQCYVDMAVPEDIMLPYLPMKLEHKLIFPKGGISGYYTFFEIRKALEFGYKILDIKGGIYYTKTKKYFEGFIKDLFVERIKYQDMHSPLELVPKILMNSLYGKFGTRIDNKTDIRHNSIVTTQDLLNGAESIGKTDFSRVKRIYTQKDIPKFINPMLSIYTTAIAKTLLYEKISEIYDSVFYIDTDSIFTVKRLDNSKELGDLKLEAIADEYYLVKPKFYALRIKEAFKCKIKGCSNFEQNFAAFKKLLEGKHYKYMKFIKLREALIRGYNFNFKLEVDKKFTLEDDKRDWMGQKFSIKDFQESKPLVI